MVVEALRDRDMTLQLWLLVICDKARRDYRDRDSGAGMDNDN